jgi:hypothetical protein
MIQLNELPSGFLKEDFVTFLVNLKKYFHEGMAMLDTRIGLK